ncbi:hypothetical protein NliqN6_6009 [Naganishia liquefaciens]|uniref:Uncharacterized protein n=1 Tax=Naganishia liquefaciens TaxID=104408 RepID=A0A8H3YIY0_9TREE|nr:hypothetical protein NliqN6_6009 [Naganishia liquefaciens]
MAPETRMKEETLERVAVGIFAALVNDSPLASPDTRDGADADANGANMLNHHAMTAPSPNPTNSAERHLHPIRISDTHPSRPTRPRQNRLSLRLWAWSYRFGWRCANDRALTSASALLNIRWRFFAVETDPRRSGQRRACCPTIPSTGGSRTNAPFRNSARVPTTIPCKTYAAPAGESTPCVIQSISAWAGDGYGTVARRRVGRPSHRVRRAPKRVPAGFLAADRSKVDPWRNRHRWLDAVGWMQTRALVIAWVIDNSLDPSKVARAEEWERTLEAYIAGLAGTAHEASLEQELNKSTNTDVKIVVLSIASDEMRLTAASAANPLFARLSKAT